MEDYKDILVFGEIDGDRISSITRQLMRIGKLLSGQWEQELCLLFLGGSYSAAYETGYGFRADRVYSGADPLLEQYMTESYLQAMEQIAKEKKPKVILFGQNDVGLDLAPRLAFRLRTGVIMDCVDLNVDAEKGLLEMVKPVFGGKAYGRFIFPDRFHRHSRQ